MKNQKSLLTISVIMMNLWVDTGYASAGNNRNDNGPTLQAAIAAGKERSLTTSATAAVGSSDVQGSAITRESSDVLAAEGDDEDTVDYVPSPVVLSWLQNNVQALAQELQAKKEDVTWKAVRLFDSVSATSKEVLPAPLNDEDKEFILGGIKAQIAWNQQEGSSSALDWLNDAGLSRSTEDDLNLKYKRVYRILDILPTAIQAYQENEDMELNHVVRIINTVNANEYVLGKNDIKGYEKAILSVLKEQNETVYNWLSSLYFATRNAFVEKVVAQLQFDKSFDSTIFIQMLDRELRKSGKPLSIDMIHKVISQLPGSDAMKESLRKEFAQGGQDLDDIQQALLAYRNQSMQVSKIVDIVKISQEKSVKSEDFEEEFDEVAENDQSQIKSEQDLKAYQKSLQIAPAAAEELKYKRYLVDKLFSGLLFTDADKQFITKHFTVESVNENIVADMSPVLQQSNHKKQFEELKDFMKKYPSIAQSLSFFDEEEQKNCIANIRYLVDDVVRKEKVSELPVNRIINMVQIAHDHA